MEILDKISVLEGVIAGFVGLFSAISLLSKTFRDWWTSPFKRNHESFVMDSERLKLIQEDQEFQNNRIKALSDENEQIMQKVISQRKEMLLEIEQMDEAKKELKAELTKTKDLLSFYKRYNEYVTGILKINNLKFKTVEEWK